MGKIIRRNIASMRNASPHSIQRTFSRTAAGCLLLVAVLFMVQRTVQKSSPQRDSLQQKDPFASIRHSHPTCQVTKVFPFRYGCPKTCKRAVSSDETMYDMGLLWYFANLNLPKGHAYEEGVNYQCPDELVDNFQAASKTVQTALKDVPGLQFKTQEYIHMSLSYFCCLRQNETDLARATITEWVSDNHPFNLDVKFDNVECWRERHNSVTNILNVDLASQRSLLALNQDLERKLLAKGIPTEVPRTEQMPFHATIFGVSRGGRNDLDADQDVTADMPEIYKQVTKLSRTFGDQWTGMSHLSIQHAPQLTSVGKAS